jgi:cell division protein FtsW
MSRIRLRQNQLPSQSYRQEAKFGAVENVSLGRRHRPDYWLMVATITLLAIGLIVIFSISPALSALGHVSASYYTIKQLTAIAIGLIVFAIAAQIPIYRWRMFAKPLMVAAVLMTCLAVILPVNPNYPAHRWVRLGSMSFQSVELLKFAVLMWLAGLLADNIKQGGFGNMRSVLKQMLIALLGVGIVVTGVQSDLGSTVVIVAIMGSMLFVAGVPMKRLLMVATIIVLLVGLSVMVMPYRRDRLMTYLHPSADCRTAGYQACQALIAVGSGGMAGLGLGSGVQAYGYLPEAANDSIFAIYAEKFGFIGVIAFFGVFVALMARIARIAERIPDNFSRFIAVGVFTWFGVQSLINIGAMIGLLPLKGITLPFVSYGGTSVIFALAAIGVLFQLSRYTEYQSRRKYNRGGDSADSTDRRRFRGAYHPNLSSRS